MMMGGYGRTYAYGERDLRKKFKEIRMQGYKITQIIPPCKCAKYYEIIYTRWESQPEDAK